MPGKRRRFPPEFKAKVALAASRGDRTVHEIAAQFEIHPNQVSTWKRQLLDGAAALFADARVRPRDDDRQALVSRLYERIGQLQVELDWLKKKVGPDD
jgi:transposase-like protein